MFSQRFNLMARSYGFSDDHVSSNNSKGRSVRNTGSSVKKKSFDAVRCIYFFSVLCIILSIGWFVYQNVMRFDRSVPSKNVSLKVSDIEYQTDTEYNTDNEVTYDSYHLVADYMADGDLHKVVLDEKYIDKDMAAEKIGQTRKVRLDLVNFKPLSDKGITLWFALPLCISLLMVSILNIILHKRR